MANHSIILQKALIRLENELNKAEPNLEAIAVLAAAVTAISGFNRMVPYDWERDFGDKYQP